MAAGAEAHAVSPRVNRRRGRGNGWRGLLLLPLTRAGRTVTGRELDRDLGQG